jgi:glycine cleavage system H protein
MSLPDNLLYTKDHEWVLIEGDTATMGITEHAQKQLGDIVFVEFPEAGSNVNIGDSLGVVESTKAVSDYYAPANGEILEVNDPIADAPETINSSPYKDGWLVKIKFTEKSNDLMDTAKYEEYLKEEQH